MAETQMYNLDDVQEYFEFTIFSKKYRFRQPNPEELEKLKTLGSDEEKMKSFLDTLVTKVDADALDFMDVIKKMTIPHWKKFNEMIKTELSM